MTKKYVLVTFYQDTRSFEFEYFDSHKNAKQTMLDKLSSDLIDYDWNGPLIEGSNDLYFYVGDSAIFCGSEDSIHYEINEIK